MHEGRGGGCVERDGAKTGESVRSHALWEGWEEGEGVRVRRKERKSLCTSGRKGEARGKGTRGEEGGEGTFLWVKKKPLLRFVGFQLIPVVLVLLRECILLEEGLDGSQAQFEVLFAELKGCKVSLGHHASNRLVLVEELQLPDKLAEGKLADLLVVVAYHFRRALRDDVDVFRQRVTLQHNVTRHEAARRQRVGKMVLLPRGHRLQERHVAQRLLAQRPSLLRGTHHNVSVRFPVEPPAHDGPAGDHGGCGSARVHQLHLAEVLAAAEAADLDVVLHNAHLTRLDDVPVLSAHLRLREDVRFVCVLDTLHGVHHDVELVAVASECREQHVLRQHLLDLCTLRLLLHDNRRLKGVFLFFSVDLSGDACPVCGSVRHQVWGGKVVLCVVAPLLRAALTDLPELERLERRLVVLEHLRLRVRLHHVCHRPENALKVVSVEPARQHVVQRHNVRHSRVLVQELKLPHDGAGAELAHLHLVAALVAPNDLHLSFEDHVHEVGCLAVRQQQAAGVEPLLGQRVCHSHQPVVVEPLEHVDVVEVTHQHLPPLRDALLHHQLVRRPVD
eukprot:Rhum_TRINITY_DN11141_c0_g1::Rhum_TRINITY_DN11141_c0_g1_i1::g.42761::m.42761